MSCVWCLEFLCFERVVSRTVFGALCSAVVVCCLFLFICVVCCLLFVVCCSLSYALWLVVVGVMSVS